MANCPECCKTRLFFCVSPFPTGANRSVAVVRNVHLLCLSPKESDLG